MDLRHFDQPSPAVFQACFRLMIRLDYSIAAQAWISSFLFSGLISPTP